MVRFLKSTLAFTITVAACGDSGMTPLPPSQSDESPEFQTAMRILDAHFEHPSHEDFSFAVNKILGRPIGIPLSWSTYDPESGRWRSLRKASPVEEELIHKATMELLNGNPGAFDSLFMGDDATAASFDDHVCSFDLTLERGSEEWDRASLAWGKCYELYWDAELCEIQPIFEGKGAQRGRRIALHIYCSAPILHSVPN